MAVERNLRAIRLIRAVVAGMAVMAAVLVVPAGVAQAGVADVTCLPPSSTTGTYSPPLTNTPQDVTVTRTTLYGPCTSLSQPAIISGTTITSFKEEDRSCTELLAPGTTVSTITWNTGQTSTLTTNNTATVVGGVFVVTNTGTVTSGLFQGDSVVRTTQAPATDIVLCMAGLGTVSSIYSVGDLVITSV